MSNFVLELEKIPPKRTLRQFLIDIAEEIPYDWFVNVKSIQNNGETFVVAVAEQFSDPKDMADKFRFEYTKQFGKDRPKITQGQINNAEYSCLRMAGKSILLC